MSLILSNLTINYPNLPSPAVASFSCSLAAGEIGCLLGASGSGKSTLLRAIAGFEPLTIGEIRLDNKILSTPTFNLPHEKREVGLMFQDYALFPHLTIAQNIAYGLADLPKQAQKNRVGELLEMVGLISKIKSYPHQLSGGEQQRIALARALAPRPRLLLLDEPFSNLDSCLCESLSLEVHNLLKHENVTALMVTHHQLEGFIMAEKMGVIIAGKLQHWTTPYELYHTPHNKDVAKFIGLSRFICAKLIGTNRVSTILGEFSIEYCPVSLTDNKIELEVLIRPDDIIHDDNSRHKALVIDKTFRGADFLYSLKLDNGEIINSFVPSHHNHPIGEKIGIRAIVDHVNVFLQE